ncbi:MAG: hypothetical protein QM630_01070 [Microbacterium sp.]
MTNIDDVAQTLAEYERLAITSGARVQIDPPEFSVDAEHWLPIVGELTPRWARATVHRDGIPTTVYASWDESLPVETAQTDDGRLWRDIWEQKPMQRFGSFIVRSALRRAFREVIGDRVEPDEDAPRVAAPVRERDWDAEIAAARTTDAVHALHKEMKLPQHRAVTVPRERALRAQLDKIAAEEWAPGEDHSVVAEPPRPAPRDHLPPANRAARRKAARRKRGGKR